MGSRQRNRPSWGPDRAAHWKRTPAGLVSIAMLPLAAIVLLVLYYYNASAKSAAEQEEGPWPSGEANKEQFVWSDAQQRWLLANRLDGPGQATPSGGGDDDDDATEKKLCIWPEDRDCRGDQDRVINQLLLSRRNGQKVYQIYVAPARAARRPFETFSEDANQDDDGEDGGVDKLSAREARAPFDGCPVDQCRMTGDINRADGLIFANADVFEAPRPSARRRDQVWIAYLLESPSNTFDARFKRPYRGGHEFNWTASYRSDSDLVTPYAKFVPYLSERPTGGGGGGSGSSERINERHLKLIRSKRKKVAWFASNCRTRNERLEYANELAKWIELDVYGECGNLTCDKWNQSGCLEMLNRDYKFYLAFENSNSPQYITEKFFRNALGENDPDYLVVPIVLGAERRDYERAIGASGASSHSSPSSSSSSAFIHVNDFPSARELANYLRLLDSDNALYYSYFSWKTMGRFVDTKFMCRVCALMHEAAISTSYPAPKVYPNLAEWFSGPVAAGGGAT